MEKLLRVSQVAETLSVSKRTVYRLVGDGELPGLHIRGCLRFQESAIEAYQRKQIQKFLLENGYVE